VLEHKWRRLHEKKKDCGISCCGVDGQDLSCPCLYCEVCNWLDCEIGQDTECQGSPDHECDNEEE